MFVCNKVDTPSEEDEYNKDSDEGAESVNEEDKSEVDSAKSSKELDVFNQLKSENLVSADAIESHPFFHGISAREMRWARQNKKRNEAVVKFERFEQCLQETLEVAIKRETKRAVNKLLMLQGSFVAAVHQVRARHQSDSEVSRAGTLVPDVFEDVKQTEAAILNTLATFGANQRGIELAIERKLQSLEDKFVRKAECYKIGKETTIRKDIETSTVLRGSADVPLEALLSVNLPFLRFVEDMKEEILDETFNALKDTLVKAMNDSISNVAEELIRLSGELQHPAIVQIFQRSYDIELSQDQSSQLLLVVLDGLLDSIDEIVTIAFRREISGPLSETFSLWEVPRDIKADLRDKESRRKVVRLLLSNLNASHVAETVTGECRKSLEEMHSKFCRAILNLRGLIEVLSSDSVSPQLNDLQNVYTPRVRGLAVEGLALQFLMDKGPVVLGDCVPCASPSQFYECVSPNWCYQGEPTVVKVVKKRDVVEEVWKRTSVDLINTW